ncbi:hypothetical protein G4228_003373 [Cervus hanglu yarkandensis]|nr:hypothetical protein G4228_003373 [Cervus hanglu yarkandensis]
MISGPVFLYILIFGKYFAPGRAQNVPCDLGYFPCGNTTECLPQQLQCNGVDDCENHVDEDNCGDINGWSTQFDRYYGNNYKMMSLYPSIVAETSECLVGSAPMQCICQGLELECDEINLRAVPSVSSNVTFMCLQNNKIRSVSVYAFRGLYNLTKLVMRKNKINHLSENTFAPLQKLDELNLSYNPIQTIQANQFDNLVKLKSLYFKRFQYCGYAPHVRICKPNTDGLSSLEDLLASIIQRVFVWVVSAVTCFGNIFVICMRPCIRSENKLHAMSIISLCCINLAAFIIIVFSYGSMFYSIHQSAVTANEVQNQVRKEMILAKRFFFIVFTDALCWIPIFILKFLSLLQVEIPGTITSWVVIFILPINSALNPILYTLTTRPFKEMIHQFWYNYRQRRSIDSKGSQKTYDPSFIWVEMWPMQEMPSELMEPVLFADPSKLSLISQSTRLNSYS